MCFSAQSKQSTPTNSGNYADLINSFNFGDPSPVEVGLVLSLSLFTSVSRIMRKPDFCLCENKGADQLRGNREADQRLCFCYSDSTIPLLLKSEISSFYLFSVLVQAGLYLTCSETTLLVFPRGGTYLDTSNTTENT